MAVPALTQKQSEARKRALRRQGYQTRTVRLADGSRVVLRRRKAPRGFPPVVVLGGIGLALYLMTQARK